MDYETQIRNNWKNFNDRRKQNKKAGQPLEHLTAGEYLSRFRKKDRLIPIISLVFYYGSELWDGPVDLYDMFELCTEDIDEVVNMRIDLLSYMYPNKKTLRDPYWPCNISDDETGTSMMLVNDDSNSSVFSQIRQLKRK